jgi:hypothetical protein
VQSSFKVKTDNAYIHKCPLWINILILSQFGHYALFKLDIFFDTLLKVRTHFGSSLKIAFTVDATHARSILFKWNYV